MDSGFFRILLEDGLVGAGFGAIPQSVESWTVQAATAVAVIEMGADPEARQDRDGLSAGRTGPPIFAPLTGDDWSNRR